MKYSLHRITTSLFVVRLPLTSTVFAFTDAPLLVLPILTEASPSFASPAANPEVAPDEIWSLFLTLAILCALRSGHEVTHL
jgi:hypothetical protein